MLKRIYCLISSLIITVLSARIKGLFKSKGYPLVRILLLSVIVVSVYAGNAAASINESHSATLLSSFALNNTAVDLSTIVVSVKDPLTLSYLLLPQNTDYIVSIQGNSILINIIDLPPAVLQPDPNFSYSFTVSYTLTDAPISVPTMNEWGIILFMVLAGFGSIYYLRRQKRANN